MIQLNLIDLQNHQLFFNISNNILYLFNHLISNMSEQVEEKRNGSKFDKNLILYLVLTIVFYILCSSYVEQAVKQKLPKQVIQFNAYFDSVATFIHPSVALSKNCTPIEWPGFDRLPEANVTVVMTSSGTRNRMGRTLMTFFTQNSYPLTKFIVIYDGKPTDYVYQMINTYRNITWIISNIRVGQLAAVDQAYRHIQTQYYFHTEDDWDYLRPGFIEYCLQALDFSPNLSGLHLTRYMIPFQKIKPFQIGPLQINTEYQLESYSGFSFWPSVHRIKDYKKLKGGYNMATYNMSFGVGVGFCEPLLSLQYSALGYYYAVGPDQFVLHSGAGVENGSPDKMWNFDKYTKQRGLIVDRYMAWASRTLKSAQQTQQNIRKSLQKSIQRANTYKNSKTNLR